MSRILRICFVNVILVVAPAITTFARSSSSSSGVQRLKQLDSGMLTLTTKRLVFTGWMESRVVNIKDIVSVEPFADAIEISTAKRAKRQVYMVGNPIIWGSLIRMII